MAAEPEKRSITILVTDDSMLYVKFAVKMLKETGYDVVTATDGRSCIETAKQLNPDLILLDVVMPEMDGFQVCKILKEEVKTREIPVIFVTAKTDDETLEKAFMAGGMDYVRKPPDKRELFARIRSALDQKELAKKRAQEEKLRGVLEMAGAVCHEMNQPLQVISGIAENMMDGISAGDPRYGEFDKIKAQVARLGRITRKLMRITRYETKAYVGETKIIDIDKAST